MGFFYDLGEVAASDQGVTRDVRADDPAPAALAEPVADVAARPLEIWRRRRARKAAGMVLTLCALSAMALGFAIPVVAVGLLAFAWLAAGFVFVTGLHTPATGFGRRIQSFVASLRTPGVLPAAQPSNPLAGAQQRVGTLAALHQLSLGSLAWPLAGASLLTPLSLHFVVSLFLISPHTGMQQHLQLFGYYIALTTLLLIPAYITLVFEGRHFARSLAGLTRNPPAHRSGLRALFATVLASFIPGIFLLGIPPLLVAATGLVFVPAIFALAQSTYQSEQDELHPLETELSGTYPEVAFEHFSQLAVDRERSADIRLLAFRFLKEHYGRERLGPVLDTILERPTDALTIHALDTCRAMVHRPPISALVNLAVTASPPIAAESVRLLVLSHGVAAEPALRRLLTAPSSEARSAVLRGLGQVGNRETIAAIHEATVASGLYFPVGPVYSAIDRIKKRLPTAERGSLSLASSSTGGELTLVSPPEPEVGASAESEPPRAATPSDP